MWLFVVVALCLASYYFWKESDPPPNFPPGPRAWPVVGNLGAVALKLWRLKCHHLVWEAWARRYGALVGLRLGSARVVIVSGKTFVREVASRPEFDGRPSGFFYMMRSFGKKAGIVFSDGETWVRRRRVVLTYLRAFGFGSRAMEYSILTESAALRALLNETGAKPVQVNDMFDVAVINVLWGLVAGKRFELTDKRLERLCALLKRSFRVVDMSGGLLNYLPFLRHVAPDLIGYTELRAVLDALHEFIAETIADHKSKVNVYQPRDVIDAFLIDMMQNKKEPISDEELQVVCLDLLQAGAETVANTLVFLVMYMVRHPDVQERVHAEVARVCGAEREPVVDDRIRMPYTEAVLMEVMRLSSVAPVGIAHTTVCSASLGGYVVPKGTLVLLSLYNMHMNEHWHDPAAFRPERFLNQHNLVVQDDWLMPFGAGRRRCLGESLARAELFLFFTTLMQKFRVSVPDGAPLPDTEPLDGVTLSAKPFQAIFRKRQ